MQHSDHRYLSIQLCAKHNQITQIGQILQLPGKSHVHWQHFLVKMVATVTDYLLALATLDDATKNRNDPISSVALPKLDKASSQVSLLLALSR